LSAISASGGSFLRFAAGWPTALRWAAGGLAAIGLAAATGIESDFDGRIGPLAGPNGALYDTAVGLLAYRDSDRAWPNTVVILIDEVSLATPPLSEAPRALFHPFLARIAREAIDLGARKVGLDFVVALDPRKLQITGASLTNYDRTFRDLLEAHPNKVVLGAYPTIPPANDYAEAVGPFGVGVVDLQEEADGVVRSTATRVALSDGRPALSFSHLLASPADGNVTVPDEERRLLFPRAWLGSAPAFSLAQFDRCMASEDGRRRLAAQLKGRNVLVGTGVSGEDMRRGPDRFLPATRPPTPAQAAARDPCAATFYQPSLPTANVVPGVYLQAAAAESAVSPATPRLARTWERAAGNALVALAALLAFGGVTRRVRALPARRPRLFSTTLRGFLVLSVAVALLAVLVVGATTLLVRFGGIWLPMGHTLVASAGLGVLAILAIAVRRDLALADLRAAFGRYLPAPVVEASLDPARRAFAGEERIITVLMADLSGFTAFCATRRDNPGSIIAELSRKFSLAQEAIDAFGGCLDKFDGDAALAFWNGIGDEPDHAARALAAGLTIIEREAREAEAAAATGAPADPLSFKISIATGVAFVGSYGSRQKVNFSAIGEPMNLAARLEKLCAEYRTKLVLSETTKRSLDAAPSSDPAVIAVLGNYEFTRVGESEVKGIEGPVAIYAPRLKGS
jgi:adenylate cyclase